MVDDLKRKMKVLKEAVKEEREENKELEEHVLRAVDGLKKR